MTDVANFTIDELNNIKEGDPNFAQARKQLAMVKHKAYLENLKDQKMKARKYRKEARLAAVTDEERAKYNLSHNEVSVLGRIRLGEFVPSYDGPKCCASLLKKGLVKRGSRVITVGAFLMPTNRCINMRQEIISTSVALDPYDRPTIFAMFASAIRADIEPFQEVKEIHTPQDAVDYLRSITMGIWKSEPTTKTLFGVAADDLPYNTYRMLKDLSLLTLPNCNNAEEILEYIERTYSCHGGHWEWM